MKPWLKAASRLGWAGLDSKGQKMIDLSEIIRVYGEPQGSPLQRPTLDPTPSPYTSPTPEMDALHPLIEEVRLLREEIRELRKRPANTPCVVKRTPICAAATS